ncbi:membrane protein insertion efficiency factor YidD [Isoptericola sp. BMS4]|uniref:membrane protein insertion efficiency factor YidD n=1 Tax=Isoptericola sp. BMS4 TaxID=2527875 RepID=UPI00141F02BF|nr:membrane protein insertion efficiency factor YidD [Isoptericola sp. BMS4]
MSTSTIGQGRDLLRNLPATVLIGVLRVYQSVISPLTGPTCKYYPSCSQYAIIAIRTRGTLRGTGLALWRILRCNPWSLGGVDDVPPARSKHVHEDEHDLEHHGA